ncbi:unnamed protein product, partial [Mesorhabditis belari]|uniref:RCC1-like domain-containing protein n=1 Tax=Mesorhabditis belari TaxID=2138241 RepID=A0AAF3F2A0_9BILA
MRRELLGFGLANEGQLGIRPNIDHGCVRMPEHIVGVPQCANEGASVKQVACGEKHTIILAEDGKMWSVGHNGFGQIGRGRVGEGSLTIYPVEYSIGSPIIEVACGREHSVCVTDDGRVFSWGNNISGQLGLNDKGTVEKPKRVEFNTQICQVACGPDHTIFLAQNGNVYVCGLQYDGATIHKPTQITDLIGVPIVRIAAGGRHWVALSSSGSVFTWGQNDCGQLGTGDQTRRGTPGLLLNISSMGVVDVSCGDAHTVLLTKCVSVFNS